MRFVAAGSSSDSAEAFSSNDGDVGVELERGQALGEARMRVVVGGVAASASRSHSGRAHCFSATLKARCMTENGRYGGSALFSMCEKKRSQNTRTESAL